MGLAAAMEPAGRGDPTSMVSGGESGASKKPGRGEDRRKGLQVAQRFLLLLHFLREPSAGHEGSQKGEPRPDGGLRRGCT